MSDAVPGYDQPEPPRADELEVSEPHFEIDDSRTLPLAASSDEADATRPAWQDEQDDSSDFDPLGFDVDPHAAESEEMGGLRFIWWDDTSLHESLGLLGDLLAAAQTYDAHISALFAHGLDSSTCEATPTLTMGDTGLVVTGLQILGLFAPELRDRVGALLKDISGAFAEPTEEQNEVIGAIHAGIKEKMRGSPRANPNEQDAGLN